MISLVVAAFLLAGAYGCGVQRIPPLNPKVVGGVEAVPHSWPWQVSLQNQEYGYWEHACGGSLIADNWILTAAHCFTDCPRCRVVLGAHNIKDPEAGSVVIRIDRRKFFVHKKWNSILFAGNDIALIKLTSPVTLSKQIDLICLPKAGTLLPLRYPCYITGWGRFYTNGPFADKLQQVRVPTFNYAQCSSPGGWRPLKSIMMCAGGDGIVSACHGDSGGPLNCQVAAERWEVHGITSFVSTFGCNIWKKPTIFTRVSAFNDWISEIMVNN
ncbi:chymotrypsin-like elastase family member 2A [Mobula hypostoma]|uniref:chymotrypsin-like elastase family member 2A n=1 Tax=Mobula hypostoma TaxID=723540 RepID=UPI002FC2DB81